MPNERKPLSQNDIAREELRHLILFRPTILERGGKFIGQGDLIMPQQAMWRSEEFDDEEILRKQLKAETKKKLQGIIDRLKEIIDKVEHDQWDTINPQPKQVKPVSGLWTPRR